VAAPALDPSEAVHVKLTSRARKFSCADRPVVSDMIQTKACDQARQYGVDVRDEKDFRENVRKWMVNHLSTYVTTRLAPSQPLLDILEDMAPYTNFPCLKISPEAARIRTIFCESSKAKDKQEELHNFIMQLIAGTGIFLWSR